MPSSCSALPVSSAYLQHLFLDINKIETVIIEEHIMPTTKGTMNSSSVGSWIIITFWCFGRVATTEGADATSERGRVHILETDVVTLLDYISLGLTLTGRKLSFKEYSISVLFSLLIVNGILV